MQCLIELYKCQEVGQKNCPQAKGCVLIEPVVTEESETGEIDGSGVGLEGSYLPPGGGSVGLGTNPQVGQIGSSNGVVSSTAGNGIGLVTPTTNNPTHGGGSGGSQNRKYLLISTVHKNTGYIISFVVVIKTVSNFYYLFYLAECIWAYFGCKDSVRSCKRRFKQCSNGQSRKSKQ